MQTFHNYRGHLQTELKFGAHSPIIRTISGEQPVCFALLRPPPIDSAVTETDYDVLADKFGSLQFAGCKKCPIHEGMPQMSSCCQKQANYPRGHGRRRLQLQDEVCIYYELAKDPDGSRMLQGMMEEGMDADELEGIFDGIIGHLIELTLNPIANVVVQKMIHMCDEDERMGILLELTRLPHLLIRMALSDYGTRVVQKLIGSCWMRREEAAEMMSRALKHGGIQRLIKNINGVNVIQSCLQHLPPQYNHYIFDAAAEQCVSLAMDRYGSRVLLSCINHFTTHDHTTAVTPSLQQLITGIASHGLHLAQDAFGNYIVQSVLDARDPTANAILDYHFRGNYVELCKHKYSSNVVERCVDVFGEQDRTALMLELLCSPQFPHLLHHPYANYVIRTALLRVTKGSSLYALTLQAVHPHAQALKHSPYFKQIHRLISRWHGFN